MLRLSPVRGVGLCFFALRLFYFELLHLALFSRSKTSVGLFLWFGVHRCHFLV